jgi:hypothetical protein
MNRETRFSRLTTWVSYAAGIATLFGACVRAAVAPPAHRGEIPRSACLLRD